MWGWQNQGSLCSPPGVSCTCAPPSSLHPQVPAQDPGRGTFVLGTQYKEPSQSTAGGSLPSCPPPPQCGPCCSCRSEGWLGPPDELSGGVWVTLQLGGLHLLPKAPGFTPLPALSLCPDPSGGSSRSPKGPGGSYSRCPGVPVTPTSSSATVPVSLGEGVTARWGAGAAFPVPPAGLPACPLSPALSPVPSILPTSPGGCRPPR